MDASTRTPGAIQQIFRRLRRVLTLTRNVMLLDVPNAIDSVWHWSEFRLNRLGIVDLRSPYAYQPRPLSLTPLFLLYIVLTWFMAFGPTSDGLCAVFNGDTLIGIRVALGIACIVVIARLVLAVLRHALYVMAHSAERLAAQYATDDDKQQRQRALEDEAYALVHGLIDKLPLKNETRESAHLTLRMLAASVRASLGHAVAYLAGIAALIVGAAATCVPGVYVVRSLWSWTPDATACASAAAHSVTVQLLVTAAVIGVTAVTWTLRLSSLQKFVAGTALWVAMIGVLWWGIADASASEATGGPYTHVYVLIVAAFVAAIAFARWLAPRMVRGVPQHARDRFRAALARTELLTYERTYPDVSGVRFLDAAMTGVSRYLGHFLLLPALAVFVAPAGLEWTSAVGFALIGLVMLIYGNLSTRWRQMLTLVRQWYLVGTARFVSYGVIGIAALRLAGVQYASTLMDAAPTGVLLVFVIMAYAVSWYYEIWINRWLGEALLGLLDRREQAALGWVAQTLDDATVTGVSHRKGRVLAIHSPGRFCAQGLTIRDDPPPGVRPRGRTFTSYTYAELYAALDHSDDKDASHDIKRRVRLYYTFVGMVLAGALFLALKWTADANRPLVIPANVTAIAHSETPERQYDLASALRVRAEQERPAVVVAASGGGTRAAVYTAVALEGLARLGRADDIVLLSGVSGGGVAAATFASRAGQLRTAVPGTDPADPWSAYVSAMGEPFIQDVLEGASELRLRNPRVAPYPLSVLLKESLQRRLFAGQSNAFGELPGLGLMLNTTVTGHPQTHSRLFAGRAGTGVPTANCDDARRPYASLAGGRLVFTNLKDVRAFDTPTPGMPDMRLPYTFVRDPAVPLAAGGALTANFPPVFPSARVDLRTPANAPCARASYFVTDGGATENLGLVSALLALASAVASLPDNAALPDIHLVATEASAISFDYAADRGLGAALGGSKERNNAGLTQRLIADLKAQLGERATLHIHYLTLPAVFRSRGGFGTHWMFASQFKLNNPLLAETPSWFERQRPGAPVDVIDLSRDELVALWRALFAPAGGFCAQTPDQAARFAPPAERVAQWICGRDPARESLALKPDWQVREWDELVRVLSVAGDTQQSGE